MEGYDNIVKNEYKTGNHSIGVTEMIRIEGERERKAGGRPAKTIIYEDTVINDKQYVKGIVYHNTNPLEFIIDKEDEEKVKSRHWYAVTDGEYIGTHVTINNSKKMLYLHNFVMNKLTFEGKGQKETVDHINRNGLDNRKENLRIISQTLQNINQKKRARIAVLPEGITDLPRHIWYIKANGNHGDRFAIEFSSEKIIKKTTSSKAVSIQDKLAQALKIRDELYEQFPYLKQNAQENS